MGTSENNKLSTFNDATSGQVALGKAMKILFGSLKTTDTDKRNAAIGEALGEMLAAHNQFEVIIDRCQLNNVRGPYKKSSETQNGIGK